MDNVIAEVVPLADVVPQGGHALQIKYAQNLLKNCLHQQQDGCDSLGRVYSRSLGSRVGSMGNQLALAAPNCQKCLPPELRQQ
jgi:hypothetical protein